MEFGISAAASATGAVVKIAPSFSSNTNPGVLSKFVSGASSVSRPQRRSACDDCRARKVQCSGDIAGCQRCRRANIKCTYSAPKPPGRPRKARKDVQRLNNNPTTTLSPSNQTHSQFQPFSTPTTLPVESSVAAPQSSSYSVQPADVGQLMDEHFSGVFGNDILSSAGNGTMTYNPTSSFPMFGGFNGCNSNGPLFPGASICHSQTSHPLATTGLNGAMTDPIFSWNPYNSLSPTPPLSALSSSPPICRPDSSAAILTPCSCLNTFIYAISTLQHPPPATTDFSLPSTLTILDSAITAIGTSIHCRYCHSSVQSTFVCMMMLGTMIPLVILYIESALKSVAAIPSGGHKMVMGVNGVEVEVAILIWKEMAHEAIRTEFLCLMGKIHEIEGILEKRHFGGKDGALRTIANSRSKQDLYGNELANGYSDISNQPADREEAGRLVGREIVNRAHETAEPPFCVGLMWMIQGMAERVKVLI